MIDLKDLGTFDSVPEIVIDIVKGNILALENALAAGWDIHKSIQLGKYSEYSPLELALVMNCLPSVRWLVEHGANLNEKENPSFLLAVRYGTKEIIEYVVAHGANIHVLNAVGVDAFQAALYGKQYENLQRIHDLGYTVQKYGGKDFRNAITDRNYEVLDFFINNGVDINYNKPDSVYPFKPTPLCVAARYVDLQMCKYLVEHGADVTITEKDGMRPYSIAIERGDMEMAEYFKNLEPAEYHDLQNKMDQLKPFKLPKALVAFLESDNLYFELPESDFISIEFFPLIYTIPFKVGRRNLLRLSKELGEYDHWQVVWDPKSKKIGCYDTEHQELQELCKFDEFIADMVGQLETLF
ncbi:ankyrin repeat domain-containing protein [Veillonella sp.]|jgi:ankyrin repeat protein|uniref:ankyrin repeat domain-containing protein n=1 Tax=Veillonella sp. TaxID=1926307 RepID=UPI00257A850B|nr:ankyrin repeat domain-containing protein [Veillonella sp.]MBS6309233.1 ankyrin repeat domain-containing protein [Veillonella sp.]MDU5864992.1 ankyrin repeat domain-containing protein [Veillonella sp.]